MRANQGARTFPYRPLLSVRTLWLTAVLWTPVFILGCAIWGSLSRWDAYPLFVGMTLTVLSFVGARQAMAARSRVRAVAWMAAGGLLAPLLIMVVVALTMADLPYQVATGGETMYVHCGQIYVALAFVGSAYAAWQSALPALLYPRLRNYSHENADRAMVFASAWVAFPSVFLALQEGRNVDSSMTLYLALTGVAPLAAALAAALRISDRRRWLRRVEEGQIPGWRLVDAAAHPAAGLVLLRGDADRVTKVLARVCEASDPFRTLHLEPVAAVGETRREGQETAPPPLAS